MNILVLLRHGLRALEPLFIVLKVANDPLVEDLSLLEWVHVDLRLLIELLVH